LITAGCLYLFFAGQVARRFQTATAEEVDLNVTAVTPDANVRDLVACDSTLAWVEVHDDRYSIVSLNVRTGRQSTIREQHEPIEDLSLSEEFVVWASVDENNAATYSALSRLTGEVRRLDIPPDVPAALSGSQLFWFSHEFVDLMEPGRSTLWTLDLQSDEVSALATTIGAEGLVAGQDLIAWSDVRNRETTGRDVYGFTPSSGQISPLVVRPGEQAVDDVSDRFVVWSDRISDSVIPREDVYVLDRGTGESLLQLWIGGPRVVIHDDYLYSTTGYGFTQVNLRDDHRLRFVDWSYAHRLPVLIDQTLFWLRVPHPSGSRSAGQIVSAPVLEP
jgi:hypothetical protein